MKRFEVGKTYKVNGGNTITIQKRTEHYATVSGDYNGRLYIYRDNFFGLGEDLMIPTEYKQMKKFCFAGKETA